ncbi:MAG: LysR family transcriptional regulator, partial [Arenibacterium sp.]
ILPCLFGDADPRLVRATTRPPTKSRDIWLLTHSDLRRTARVQAFMRFAETLLRRSKDRLIGRV